MNKLNKFLDSERWRRITNSDLYETLFKIALFVVIIVVFALAIWGLTSLGSFVDTWLWNHTKVRYFVTENLVSVMATSSFFGLWAGYSFRHKLAKTQEACYERLLAIESAQKSEMVQNYLKEEQDVES